MSEKKYLISLIDRFLDEPVSDRDKNINYFKGVLSSISSNPLDVYDFIIGINDDLIGELSSDNDFISSFNELRKKIVSFKDSGKKFSFSKDESLLIDRFKALIKEYCMDSNLSTYPYILLKNKFLDNRALDVCDYDLVEELICRYEDDSDAYFEDAMDYLNRYNIGLIRRFSKPKKVVKYTKVGDSKSDVFVSLDSASCVNPFDNMVSFDFVPKERSRVNRKRKVERICDVDCSSVFSKYGYVFEDILEVYRNNISSLDAGYVDSYLNFLEGYKDLVRCDLRCLGMFISDIPLDDFKSNLGNLRSLGFNDDSICEFIKRYGRVFLNSEFDNFRLNYDLLVSCGVSDFNGVVKNNISFFHTDYKSNLEKFNGLSALGVNASEIVRCALGVFVLDYDLIKKNIEILDSYGFDLRDEKDFSSFSVLGLNDLGRALDMFIESGFSEYIHDDASLTLRNIKSLIIKRILFSYRNGLYIWDNRGDVNPCVVNDVYEEYIRSSLRVLSGSEIDLLIKEHPILELLEYGKRLSCYNDSYFGNIRRKTEFVFGNKIISRIKTYSVFNALVCNGVNEEEALVYALCYNSVLDNSEYELLKSVVYRGNGVKSI